MRALDKKLLRDLARIKGQAATIAPWIALCLGASVWLARDMDLLALGGKDVTLPAGFLPAGTYDQLVVVMTKLELTLAKLRAQQSQLNVHNRADLLAIQPAKDDNLVNAVQKLRAKMRPQGAHRGCLKQVRSLPNLQISTLLQVCNFC